MTDIVTVVTNPSTNTVEIVSAGPQGPQGPQGVKGDVGDVNPDMITLRDAAAASATAAAGSASSASTSASTATTQASSASGSASTATSQATIATNQATTATTKAGEASTSATNAAASAGTASSSATTATTKASEASTSASNAAGSASTAISQATIATTKAAEADASATAAAGSASSASTSAATASTQATNAANSQSTATSAAATATTQATNASTSAATATTKANDAANSATTAQNAATTASTQANSAIASAAAAAASQSAAAVSESGASAGAATSTAKASEAAGSAAAINATFGNAASVALQAQNAQAAASLAQGYAASASSVVQQDLSGITAQALHRSPNAITAQFIYDTSKDSDGGAWTEKCQQTSWYNEALAGKWLGPQDSEFQARNSGSTISATELVTNGDFSNGSTGWTQYTGTLSVSDGIASFTPGSTGESTVYRTISVTTGKTYKLSVDVLSVGSGTTSCRVQVGTSFAGAARTDNGQTNTAPMAGTKSVYFTATAATLYVQFAINGTVSPARLDNISVREVTAMTTASNDYFQLTTDGKFYRLWKNLFARSNEFENASWVKVGGASITSTANSDPFGGSTARELTGTSVSSYLQYNIAPTGIATLSLYAKAGTVTSISIGGTGLAAVSFDLSAVTATTSVSFPTTSITPVGGGWYRCVSTLAAGVSVSSVRVISGGNGTVLIYGAQLELGTVATSYEPKAAEGTTSEIFRGNKADFPRLAAIVAEASNVTIYDLTEPGRPMWMRFVRGSNINVATHLQSTTTSVNSVSAMNGNLALSLGSAGYARIDFGQDAADYKTIASSVIRPGNISQRNTDYGTNGFASGGSIANTTVNAVAMTVLPDAPIDPATGLRVPTIAVATSGGVSVIKHNGTVVNSSSTASSSSVQITKDRLISQRTGNAINFAAYPGALGASFAMAEVNSASLPDFARGNSGKIVAKDTANIARFPSTGVTSAIALLRDNDGTRGRGLSAHIQNTHNTGWLTGDIRRAYLSDVTAESISGTELVTNGDFSSGTGWTLTGSAAIVSGELVFASGATGTATQSLSIAANSTVRIRLNKTVLGASGAANAVISFRTGVTTVAALNIGGADGPRSYDSVFTLTAAVDNVYISYNGSGAYEYKFDNASVVNVVLDRSYKAASAPVFGTLTKSQLASGTSLVGYSGFSASNYLREPYSADLDFGTGEWNASAWVNVPVTLTDASFGATSVPTTLDTAEWTKGTGWSAPSANSFSCNGTQTTQTDLTWSSGNRTTSNSSIIRRWTITVTAISGTMVVYPNNGSPISITATGTYYGYSNPMAGTETTAIIRMAAAGQTCTGTLAMDDLSPTRIGDRAHTSGPSFRLGINRIGLLTATAFDGTTTRTVTTTAAYNTAQWLKAEANYTTDGSLTIRVNGREVAATRGNPLLTLNNTSAVLTIGNSYALDAPFPGSIALLKLGATVPTPEQATFMYEQEKQLFRAGALSVLPDAGAVVDMAYDDATDRWVAVSAANESYWTGLIRNTVTPVPAGSYTRVIATSGIELAARSTTNPGVDVTIPAYGLREELVKRAEAAARLSKELATFDYVGGFTANTTNGNTAITSASTITYPASYIGARISGSGIPTNATIVAVSGTTLYLSAAATATATGVSITFLDFELPVGMEAKTVMSAGSVKQEGSTKDYTRLYDGFIETIRFGTAPGATTWVQIQAQRISQ